MKIIAIVAFVDPVAFKKIWMIGYLLGPVRVCFMSPILNKITTEKAIVMAKFMICAVIMLRGTTIAEFLTSSPDEIMLTDIFVIKLQLYVLIWLVQSKPQQVWLVDHEWI